MADIDLTINSADAPIALAITTVSAPISLGTIGLALPGPPGADGADGAGVVALTNIEIEAMLT